MYMMYPWMIHSCQGDHALACVYAYLYGFTFQGTIEYRWIPKIDEEIAGCCAVPKDKSIEYINKLIELKLIKKDEKGNIYIL